MTPRLYPHLPAEAASAEQLRRLILAPVLALADRSAVDQALECVALMQRFVIHDTDGDATGALPFTDAASVLAAEVNRLRSALETEAQSRAQCRAGALLELANR